VKVQLKNLLTYNSGCVILPLDFVRQIKAKERMELFRDAFVDEVKGKIDEEKDIEQGTLTGKEYVISTGQGQARLRLFLVGSRVLRAMVHGTKEQVQSNDVNMFLDSYRGPTAPEKKPDDKAGGDAPNKPDEAPKKTDDKASLEAAKAIPGDMYAFIQNAVKDKKTKDIDIAGFKLSKKEYRDLPEEGGVLIGFEVGLGKFAANDTVDSLRPIYLTKDGEKKGAWQGKTPDKPIEVKAKPGYVVGGLTVRAGLVVDAFSVTFMKLDKNQLDVKDSYTSEWIGGEGGGKATVGGKGQIFVGVVGHLNDAKSVCSIGLITVLKPKE
jgi:hypothetical protein